MIKDEALFKVTAKMTIYSEIEHLKKRQDAYKYWAAYTKGVIELAFILEAINENDKKDYIKLVETIESDFRSYERPVFLASGLHKYKNYYIVRDAIDNWDSDNSCRNKKVKKMGDEAYINDTCLTMAEAIALIDNLTKNED